MRKRGEIKSEMCQDSVDHVAVKRKLDLILSTVPLNLQEEVPRPPVDIKLWIAPNPICIMFFPIKSRTFTFSLKRSTLQNALCHIQVASISTLVPRDHY